MGIAENINTNIRFLQRILSSLAYLFVYVSCVCVAPDAVDVFI